MAAYRPTDKMAGRRFPCLRFVCTILRLSPIVDRPGFAHRDLALISNLSSLGRYRYFCLPFTCLRIA